jgi:hypothetical protein
MAVVSSVFGMLAIEVCLFFNFAVVFSATISVSIPLSTDKLIKRIPSNRYTYFIMC